MHRINHNAFIANLTPTDNLWNYALDLNALCDLITDTLYNASKTSKQPSHTPSVSIARPNSAEKRWNNIVSGKDIKQLWRAIDWKGNFSTPSDATKRPSDKCFCEHYSDLLGGHEVAKVYEPQQE